MLQQVRGVSPLHRRQALQALVKNLELRRRPRIVVPGKKKISRDGALLFGTNGEILTQAVIIKLLLSMLLV